jgi:hypothetical protein
MGAMQGASSGDPSQTQRLPHKEQPLGFVNLLT